ncbi:MAG: phage major capsid protein [Lachnospiraceae bacterium]|nr:phage major capsid protein [Lachnospiraceae bacterium]MBQ9749472.1 phage major capsid protein [Clostridia bacterium]
MPTGTPTNRSNLPLPNSVSSEILQKTQEASAIMQLARQIPLPGNGLQIPVITSDPIANWVTETGIKPVSNPGLDKKIMQAHKLAVIVPFSDEFRRDTSRLYSALLERLPKALSKEFDKTVFFGPSSTLANFDDFSAVTAQSISGTGGVYAALVAADTDISEEGGTINGYVISPQGRGELLGAVDDVKRPLFVNSVAESAIPRILGSPTYFRQAAYQAGSAASGADPAVPDIIGFAGDWSHAMWGTVEGVKIDISKEATLTTESGGETVTINLWQQNMFAVRAEIEVGFVAETEYFNALTRTHSA